MCCTVGPAKLSNTILYAGEAEVDGKYVHVLGYQNRATNLTTGPNAMILPFPAAKPMGPGNVVDTSSCKSVLKDYAAMFKPRTRSFGKGLRSESFDDDDSIQVFDSGIYTIVLAKDARFIPAALNQVPVAKRPAINATIFEAYAVWYPEWPIALCCFSSTAGVDAEPLLWWYEPATSDQLFAPALDGHDGQPPRVGARVEVDHTVMWGSTIKPYGAKPRLTEPLSPDLQKYIPSMMVGSEINQVMPNGDFYMKTSKLGQQRPGPERLPPPGLA